MIHFFFSWVKLNDKKRFIYAGLRADGKEIFLRDIWPTRAEIQAVEQKHVIPAMFKEVYSKIENGSISWSTLRAPEGQLYPWDDQSTYIKHPPYFEGLTKVRIFV